jgi:GNAT superfamily N-acetyltransferase
MEPLQNTSADNGQKSASETGSPIRIEAISSAKEREVFLHVPWDLGMPDDPMWVPPLLDDYRRMLDPAKSPFLNHGELQCFIAYQNNRPVGRISAQIDFEYDRHWRNEPKTAFFGFFECKNDPAVARALLSAAEAWAKKRGRVRMFGPYTLDSKGESGLLVDGFQHPPRIGTTYNKAYLGSLVEAAGFTKAKDLYCWWYQANSPIDAVTKRLADRTRALPNVRVRTANLKEMRSEVEIVREIYNEAWGHNWNTVPFTTQEIEIMATEYKQFLDPEIVLIAEVDGEPAALCLAVPDLNEIIKDFNGELMKKPLNIGKLLWRLRFARPKAARLILLGIKEKYRASRKYGALAAVLYEEVAIRGSKRGYVGGELGWTLEDNIPINKGIERMGAKHYKTYRVYERQL